MTDAAEGYADMTVEKGKMEYSFAFFYYNPYICGIESQSAMEGIDENDEHLVNSPFPDAKLISNNGRNDNGDNISSSSSTNDTSNISSSSGSSSNGNSTLFCMNTPNQIHCQSNLQASDGMYTSFWGNLMKTH